MFGPPPVGLLTTMPNLLPVLVLAMAPFSPPHTGSQGSAAFQVAGMATAVECTIRAEKGADGTRLKAVVIASGDPVRGTYDFTVLPKGDGKPLAERSGTFELAAANATPADVAAESLTLPESEGYRASLRVTWPNGSASCSASAG